MKYLKLFVIGFLMTTYLWVGLLCGVHYSKKKEDGFMRTLVVVAWPVYVLHLTAKSFMKEEPTENELLEDYIKSY